MYDSILLVILFLSSGSCDCGYPGFSKESEVIPDNRYPTSIGRPLSSFREYETVRYGCSQYADIVIGSTNRTCINNEWTGVVPKFGE